MHVPAMHVIICYRPFIKRIHKKRLFNMPVCVLGTCLHMSIDSSLAHTNKQMCTSNIQRASRTHSKSTSSLLLLNSSGLAVGVYYLFCSFSCHNSSSYVRVSLSPSPLIHSVVPTTRPPPPPPARSTHNEATAPTRQLDAGL